MKRKNFVSIIIPTYKEEKHIENTLRAIRNQDYKNFEVIVSDSKSGDKTRKIAKKYKAKIVVGERKGVGAGRNLGAKHARGDILLFVDADTVIMWNTVSELVKGFSSKSIVGVTCPVLPLIPTAKNIAAYATYNKFAERSLRKQKNPIVAGICVAYRRKDFFDIGGFNENTAAFEDLDLSRRIAKKGKILFTYNTFVLTSPRRVEIWGYKKLVSNYLKFYLRYMMRKKIKLNEYRPVR